MEQALVAHLKAHGILSLFPQLAPQETPRPFVVYQTIRNTRPAAQSGALNYRQAVVQIDCYADSYASAKELAEQIEKLADSFAGSFEDGGVTTIVQGTFPQGQRDLPATTVTGAGKPIRRRSQEWTIHYHQE